MAPQQGHQVVGFQPDGGGVVVGVDPDQAGGLPEVPVHVKLHPARGVVQQAQGSHRPGNQAQDLPQLLGGGKGQGLGALFAPEVLQVDPLVPLDGDQVVVPPLVVPDKEILCVAARVGQGDLFQLLHVVHCGMLGDLMPDLLLVQKPVDFVFVHLLFPPVSRAAGRLSFGKAAPPFLAKCFAFESSIA